MNRSSFVIAIAAVFLSACNLFDSAYNADRTPKMDKPSPRIEKLFSETKPVCFGRFVIDVPKTANVIWGPTHVGDPIVSFPDEGFTVPARIRDKIKALKEERHASEPSSYIGTFDGPNDASKIVVGYASFESSGRVQLHSYVRLGKHAFVQSVSSFALDYLPGGGDDKTSYKKALAELQDAARRLRGREEDEIPGDPGICIEAGFISDGTESSYELTSVGFRFPEYPDVVFSIQARKTGAPSSDNSLERSLRKGREYAQATGKGDLYGRIITLRKGDRRLGDWEGAEMLARLPAQEDSGPSVHDFEFRSIGVASDALRPSTHVHLSTGVEGNEKGVNEPSLKDEDVVALWDKLTFSIRARPVGQRVDQPASEKPLPQKQSAAPVEPPRMPLGTQLASGTRCPQTGSWVCAETEVLGASRRDFTAGETLPSVIVPLKQTFAQKFFGAPKNDLHETVWTLVELPEPKV